MLSQCARFIRRLCFTRRALTVACFLLVAAGVALFYSNWLIVNASQHLTWNDIQTVPARNVGLVLALNPAIGILPGGLILPPRCITPVK